MRKTSVWLLACLLSAGSISHLAAQVGRATLTGVVRDTSNAVVPGVAVKVTSTTTKVEYTGSTNESGIYTIGALPMMVLFFSLQKYFLQGITIGAVKG